MAKFQDTKIQNSEALRQGFASQMALIPFKKTTFSLPLDLYKELKIEAARRDTEMSSIVADALRKHLSENEHEQ